MTENQKYVKQLKYFESLLHTGFLGHAYLFVGPDFVGKKEFAEIICSLLTGKNFNNNPDLKFITSKKEEGDHKIYIENIRDLKSFMSLRPHSSEYKLAIIEDVDLMTTDATNAILKILEEPPQKSVLILISSKPKLLSKTILSRCETVVFSPLKEVETDEMIKALSELRRIAKQNMAERIKYAKKIYEKEDYAELIDLWLKSLRLQLGHKPVAASILKNLLQLSQIVSQPQYNHRIALENFFVNL